MSSLDHSSRLGPLLLALTLLLSATPVEAKTINLGGGKVEKQKSVLFIELPSIEAALPKGDDNGGWRHVRIDAYITPKDVLTGTQLEAVKSSIVKHAAEETLPAAGYDKLKSPYGGEEAAKKALRIATDRALGHPWEGEISIRTFLTY